MVVSAVDGKGGSDAITVTISVIDVAEAPSRPDAPSVTGGVEKLSVSWDAPANTGPEITGYEVAVPDLGYRSISPIPTTVERRRPRSSPAFSEASSTKSRCGRGTLTEHGRMVSVR